MKVVLRCATGWLLATPISDQDDSPFERRAMCSPGISPDRAHAVWDVPIVLCSHYAPIFPFDRRMGRARFGKRGIFRLDRYLMVIAGAGLYMPACFPG